MVVGGGVAGFAAATALAEAGREVLLLESTAAGGGRARSFVDRRTGDAIDNGQHALMGCYDEFLRLLSRLGTRQALYESELRIPLCDPALPSPSARTAAIEAVRLPAPLHFAARPAALRHLSLRERLAALVAGQRLVWRYGPASAPDVTVAAALDALGQSARARHALWDPLVWATLNADPERASARLLAAVVGRALLASRDGSRFLLPALPLSELYVEPGRKYLEARGGAVRTRAAVDTVCVEGGRSVGVRVDGERIDADAVILAVPPPALQRLAIPGVSPHASLAKATPIVSVTLWLDRDPGGPPFLGLLGCDTQWIFQVDRIHGRRSAGGHRLACVRSGAEAWEDVPRPEIAAAVLRDARRALPGMANVRVLHDLVVTEHAATLAPDPELQPLRPGCRTVVEGLFLAGDWIDTGLPATLESAALSGHRAATAALGRPVGGSRSQGRSPMSAIGERKNSHLALCAEGDVEHRQTTLLEEVRLLHDALPELSVHDVDLSVEMFGRRLQAPLLISGMSGGTPEAGRLNRALATVAQKLGFGFGVGSQRPMLLHPETAESYRVRDIAPDVLLLGNVGVVQAREAGVARVTGLLETIGADGLCVHLNAAQELVQEEGDRDFRGTLDIIAQLVDELSVPVIVKETGCGLAPRTLERLHDVGVRWVDVSGAGGTSWTAVESLRGSERQRALGRELRDWGIPTAASIVYARRQGLGTIASGGIRSGLDAARALALGADMVSLALPLLRAFAAGGVDAALGTAASLVESLRAIVPAHRLAPSRGAGQGAARDRSGAALLARLSRRRLADGAGRVAVITGGSGGIGAALAFALGQRGLSLALLARGRERLEAAAGPAARRRMPGYDTPV